jgi:hypothetical protein
VFDDPVAAPMGDRVPMETFLNKLIIVRPLEFKRDQKTEFKPDGAEAVFANIALLEPIEGEPWKIYRRVLVMQGYLVGDFKASLNINLLGTIYHGDRKPGQKPPYKFRSLKSNQKALDIAAPWMREHEAEFLAEPEPVFGEVVQGEEKRTTLDTMRSDSNPWAEEPPF